jgi:hypothetical protein
MLREFGRAITSSWATRMSGPASVPAAFASAYLSNSVAKALFGITAIGCALFTAYWVWRAQRLRVVELEQALDPRVTLDFNPNRAPWVMRTELTNVDPPFNHALYVRVRARSATQIANCRGILKRVLKLSNGEWEPTSLCEPQDLIWSNYPAPTDRLIRVDAGVDQCLDVCRILESNAVIQPTIVGFAMPNHSLRLFDRAGTYRFDVAIAGDGNARAEISISLETGPTWDTPRLLSLTMSGPRVGTTAEHTAQRVSTVAPLQNPQHRS